MAIYRYTTKPQLERGLEIILKPCGSSDTVNNMDLSKKQDRGKREHKLDEIDRSQSKNQSWNKENQAKLEFLLCLVK